MTTRDVAPLACANPDRIWNKATLRKPAIITWMRWPRGTLSVCPVRSAAPTRVRTAKLDPKKRNVQGEAWCNAMAPPIQLPPQAKASRNTSVLSHPETTTEARACGIDVGFPDRGWDPRESLG